MAVIVITFTSATEQLISGIPKTVTITTNIPALVFYTLDGTTPTTGSDLYTDPVSLPTNQPGVTLKAFATNGVDTSDITTQRYSPDITHARLPYAKVQILTQPSTGCGTRGDSPTEALYSQPADTPLDAFGVTPVEVDGYGYDPSVYPMQRYDQPKESYPWIYSETNAIGEMGRDIGTLPARATVIYAEPPPEESELNKATYNPKAWVTIHDGTQPNENEDTLFRPYYDGENVDAMYGSRLGNSAMRDGDMMPNGSALRYQYNPRENTVTFYYRDSRNNRWIISKEPVRATLPTNQTPLYNFVSPNCGDRHVYRWILFRSTFVV